MINDARQHDPFYSIQCLQKRFAGVLKLNWLESSPMPELCRFFGIIITMYYDDHAPPHFHVRYSDYKAIMGIDSLMLLDGCSTHTTI